MAEERPNFYELLELDPSIDDWEEIRTVLEKKKKRWNQVRTQQSGTRRSEAEARLAWVAEMARVLADPAGRRREAEARRRQLEGVRQEALAELDRRIESLRQVGEVSQSQVEKLVAQFAGRLEQTEVLARLDAAGLGNGGASSDRDFLPDRDLDEIRHELDELGQGDLYAFLGASPSAAPQELVRLADQRYKEKAGRSDRKSEAAQKLAGICQALFQRDGGKAVYDASVATLPLRQLHDDLDLLENEGELPAAAVESVVGAAAAQHVDRELARDYVHWYARERGWSVAQPSPEAQESAKLDDLLAKFGNVLAERERQRAAEERRRTEEERRRAEAARQQQPPPVPMPPPSSPAPLPPPPAALDAPVGLDVRSAGKGFQLRWNPVAGQGVIYHVVRKRGSAPSHENDGEFQEQVVMNSFQDLEVPSGEWHYAVFAVRNGEASLDAAVSGPHQVRRSSSGKKAAVAAGLAIALGASAFVNPQILNLLAGLVPNGCRPVPDEVPKKEEKVEEVKPPPPIRVKPKLAIIATGERQLRSSVEDTLVSELGRRGLDVAGRSGLLHTEGFLAGSSNATANALMPVVAQDGVDVLVRADVEKMGEQVRQFLGRREVTTISRIAVRAYLVAEKKPLGTITSDQVEHSPLNAVDRLQGAAWDLGNDIRSAVNAGWADYRKRNGLTP